MPGSSSHEMRFYDVVMFLGLWGAGLSLLRVGWWWSPAAAEVVVVVSRCVGWLVWASVSGLFGGASFHATAFCRLVSRRVSSGSPGFGFLAPSFLRLFLPALWGFALAAVPRHGRVTRTRQLVNFPGGYSWR